ncbi:DNA gyrase subunit A [Petrotoga sp. HKA.pet.4.5]|uniref:DNA gyrase subunit A n=1 Tax=Petrotoga sp. HKA.pet.4.5 TaxID=1473155 RepID=UPI000EF14FE8|nr:DNA gyrase subunit A [Petrotoga sp. HKA.pet.4.5]RLL89755.1 DNA gyrase subunit A [Petrotoga sp. HKA.pet.4.5]
MDDKIFIKDFTEELKTSYLLYSLSVIVSRAIPDVRDGLKPVQRRILYSMSELGLKHNSSFKKNARIVGEVMGKYHPHGDAAIYDALVRMGQPFTMRYPLVEAQGNFGSIDGDPPAAMRYTEARMPELGEYMLKDIEKETVDFRENFDGSLSEPVVLPTMVPNLLMNGASGIAVGMTTNIPPHNLNELVAALKLLIEKPESEVADLLKYIKGPDFPTGGLVVDGEGLKDLYETGRGKITIRGKYRIEDVGKGTSIVFDEIPYNVSKADIIEQIVRYVVKAKEQKKDVGIKDVRDESDKEGIRLVIELRRNANVKRLINDLFKHTNLQSYFYVQMNVIDNEKPTLMNLKGLLQSFLDHRVNVITRRTQYELEKARKRAHIVEGLIKAVQGIDTVVEIIRNSENPQEALKNLQETIGVSEEQAKAIADMRLISLSKLESTNLSEELKNLYKDIENAMDILQKKERLMEVIKEELDEVANKFGDKRRTEILYNKGDLAEEVEMIQDEDVVIVLTKWGYLKAIPSSEYKVQGRGGKGVKGLKISDEDDVKEVIYTNKLSKLMLFSSAGKAYQINAYEIETTSKSTKGKHIANFISLDEGEEIKSIVAISLDGDYDKDILIFTKQGKVKRTSLREFSSARASGIRAINLLDNDVVVDVVLLDGSDRDLLIVTRLGMSLMFNSSQVRTMGRTAMGVNSIKLREGDEVIDVVKVDEGKKLLLITERGYGKRVSFHSYKPQNRGGIGVKTVRDISRIGPIVATMSVEDGRDILIFTKKGKAIRVNVNNINVLGRITQGVIIVRLDEDDSVVGVIEVQANEEE